jgi:branched-chain amino acid transport system substrate-binding protein
MSEYLKAKDPGAVIVGADQVPFGTTDFSAYLTKLRGSNPQVAYITLGGLDLTNFFKQFRAVGLTGKVLVGSPIVDDSSLWDAGPETATGIYGKIWNYTGPYNTPKSVAFVKKYQARFGKAPEAQSWQDWFGVTAILTAIQETKSTDSKKLVQFLETHKFEGYKEMPMYFRAWDHQLIQPTLVSRVKQKITDKYDYFDILSQFPQGGAKELDAFYGTKQEVGCNMGPL